LIIFPGGILLAIDNGLPIDLAKNLVLASS
jgi:hypothetical protein